MHNVRIALTETGTGCEETFDTQVEQVTLGNILSAVRSKWNEQNSEACSDAAPVVLQAYCWVGNRDVDPDHFAFIFRWDDSYFGDRLVHGVVYTNFI